MQRTTTVAVAAHSRNDRLALGAAGMLALAAVVTPGQAWLSLLRGPGPYGAALLEGSIWLRGSFLLLAAWIAQEGWRGAFAKHDRTMPSQHLGLGKPLLAILLVGTITRLIFLGTSLWGDEVETLVRYVRLPPGEIVSTYHTQNQQFLYSLMAAATTGAFGESAWALRLPAAALGVASLYALASLAARAGARREGLWAAGLLAVSYHHVWFSQNARGYTGLLAAALFSTELFVRALEERRPSLWRWYGVVCALGAWVHMNMIFVVAGQFAAWLALHVSRKSEARGQALSGFALAAVLTLALHAVAAPQILGPALADRSEVSEWKNPLWTLTELAPSTATWGVAAGLAALAIVGWGAWDWLRAAPGVAVTFGAALAAGLAVTIALGHPIWPRFFFFEIGFVALALVRGVMLTLRSPQRATVALAALIAASAATLPAAYRPKQDYTGARDFIAQRIGSDERCAASGVASFVYANYYAPQWARIETAADLETLERESGGVWFLYSLPLHMQAYHPDVYARVQESYRLETVFPGTLGDGDVYVYHRRAGGGTP